MIAMATRRGREKPAGGSPRAFFYLDRYFDGWINPREFRLLDAAAAGAVFLFNPIRADENRRSGFPVTRDQMAGVGSMSQNPLSVPWRLTHRPEELAVLA
jgi:hypothetical protein